jgi:hypothetical protein
MPFYYAYHVDEAGHVIRRFDIHAGDDEQAVERAMERLSGHDIEVWCIDRKVTFLKRHD